MAEDALDPGVDGSYPHFPRLADGSWDVERMPVGRRKVRDPATGKLIVVDLTPRDNVTGEPICPPDMELPPGIE